MDKLTLIPLGGFGEFGKNCTVLKYGDDLLVIDVGLQFPDDDMPGVDLVIPDFTYLVQHRAQIQGIVFTHGHEDHIGALPYLLAQIPAKLYATPLTRGLIEGKLREDRLMSSAELHTILPGQEITLGAFKVTAYHVNHSIPDSIGLAIRTPLGLVVHTGDFKIDHTPIDGKTIDLGALAKLSMEGVLLLLSDSTNAESIGYTMSESRIIDSLQQVFSHAQGRIIIATFASLISRIQLVIQIAAQFGRKVAIAGRSMEESISIAEKLGYISFPAGLRMPITAINALPPNEVCILATGSQGEPTAALGRMAKGHFRNVTINEGDTVVYSSKAIPGNETAIYRTIDELFRLGADVIYGEQAGVHVSGHAAQEELKLLLNLLRPLYFVPMHGAHRMLYRHAQLAYSIGYSREDVFVLENGHTLECTAAGARLGEVIAVNTVYVDGSLVGDVGNTVLRDRMTLSQDGFVIAKVTVDGVLGRIAQVPELISQGFIWEPTSAELLHQAQEAIAGIVSSCNGEFDADTLAQRVKGSLERLFYNETKRRPVVIPMIIQS
ncbi:MAG: ribonuclease J [Chloroflexi bacterium]|nr:ribonuclease J [Chloroflexota bacterium]